MKYSAINIGPILSTFEMGRRPRELWSASYLFSYLMRCIYNQAEKDKLEIISPDKPKNDKNKIGIYPDRIFIKGNFDVVTLLKSAKKTFVASTGISEHTFEQYFNVMSASKDFSHDSTAIGDLNQCLDVQELCNYAADHEASDEIRKLITKTAKSPLFKMETDDQNTFPFEINTLAEIATAELRGINEPKWKELRDAAREKERTAENFRQKSGQAADTDINPDLNEDDFYKALQKSDEFKDLIKSHHKYFCVVQADGDNVGKTVSHFNLKDGQVKAISTKLVKFGIDAAQKIEEFGGMPIYAGGDDLLFIAPVVGKVKDTNGKSKNILDLINTLETVSFAGVVDAVDKCETQDGNKLTIDGKQPIKASLSFGIAISYYKYPLYNVLRSAAGLLFESAKKISQKKAVAWSLRKHSGGTFEAAFSLSDDIFKAAFRDLIKTTTDGEVISAVAHKLWAHEALVASVMKSKQESRLDALFDNILEFKDNDYFKAVKAIMPHLYETVTKEKFIPTLYSLLRTAKFIKGEDLHDE